MIFESEQEKEAFNFMYELASRGCNDLEDKDVQKFKGLKVPTDDEGKIVDRDIVYDFDVCYWLSLQAKEGYK